MVFIFHGFGGRQKRHFGYFSRSRRRGERLSGKPTLAIIRAGLLSSSCAHPANLSNCASPNSHVRPRLTWSGAFIGATFAKATCWMLASKRSRYPNDELSLRRPRDHPCARRRCSYNKPARDTKPAGVGAVSQRLISTDKRSGLLTRIAATESVSLCERMKSWLRCWNWNRWFVLAPNCLDKGPGSFANSVSTKPIWNQAEGSSPCSVLRLVRTRNSRNQNQAGKGRK